MSSFTVDQSILTADQARMSSTAKVYIAGVGFSPIASKSPSAKVIITSLVSAATKVLLDTGVTYSFVTQCVTSKASDHGLEALKMFDEGDTPVEKVESGSELDYSLSCVTHRGAKCVLLIVNEESAALAFVLVSNSFLWSHPYLKDSAILLSNSDVPASKSKGPARTGLLELCQTVWALRGWCQDMAAKKGRLHFQTSTGQSFELSRADDRDVPAWKDVEHKQDGKHRLGHNPALKTKEISFEDFEAVATSGKSNKQSSNRLDLDHNGGDKAALLARL